MAVTSFTCPCGNTNPAEVVSYCGPLGYEAIICKKCACYSDEHSSYEADQWSRRLVGIKESSLTKLLNKASSFMDGHNTSELVVHIAEHGGSKIICEETYKKGSMGLKKRLGAYIVASTALASRSHFSSSELLDELALLGIPRDFIPEIINETTTHIAVDHYDLAGDLSLTFSINEKIDLSDL